MRFPGALLLLAIAAIPAAPARAGDFDRMMEAATTDERVRAALDGILRNIDKAACGPAPCAMTTREELANPPVTLERARSAMRQGIASATLDWCGQDWRGRVLVPMMAEARRDGLGDRQATVLMALHAAQHMPLARAMAAKGPCPDDLRARLAADAPPGGPAPIPGLVETPGRDGSSPAKAIVLRSREGSVGALRAELAWIERMHPGRARRPSRCSPPPAGR